MVSGRDRAWRWLQAVALACSFLAASAVGASADGAAAGWAALKAPGAHVLMRHAIAPGTGDPEGFTLGDCTTQRNLDRQGRAQAERIGASIREAGITVDRVLSSEWCRARDTAALLGVAPVVAEPALNSFFEDRGTADAASRAVRDRLAALPPGEKLVMVTHQVNITALTGIFPASGEMIVVAREADGTLAVRGRIRLD